MMKLKLTKVLLKTSSDPNEMGKPLGSARLTAPELALEFDVTTGCVVVNGSRLIPRELVLHMDTEQSKAKEPEKESEAPYAQSGWGAVSAAQNSGQQQADAPVVCPDCAFTAKNNAGLAVHRRRAHPEAAA